MIDRPLRLTAWVVTLHFVIAMVHGAAHERLVIELPFLKNLFVYAAVLVGPLVALALIWRRRERTGYALLLATMAGGLLFGAYHHFVLDSSDHLAHIPAGAWGTAFSVTAVLLALTETAGCAVAIWRLRRGAL